MDRKEKPTILVVDDIPQNVRLLEMNLKAEGYNILSAYSGQEAIEKAKSEKPALILLDVMMPVMDGDEVCRAIRADKEISWIPIIMITAHEGGAEKVVESLNAGADDFIRKPFNRHELLARVRSLLRVKELHDDLTYANQRLEEELILAKEVQQALLPQEYPRVPSLMFYHRYIPTLAIGGDFFDILELTDSNVGIFICDVMGHGPQAAMITGIIKLLLRQFGLTSQNPSEILVQMNERFCNFITSTGLPIFTTAFYLTIDVIHGIMKYSNAGHPAPIAIKGQRSYTIRLSEEPGPALGMIPDAHYKEHEFELEPNDMVFLFTDGLEELMNRNNEQFGTKEMEIAIKSNMHLSPKSFVESLICSAEAFSEGLNGEDDITLLAFSYIGV